MKQVKLPWTWFIVVVFLSLTIGWRVGWHMHKAQTDELMQLVNENINELIKQLADAGWHK